VLKNVNLSGHLHLVINIAVNHEFGDDHLTPTRTHSRLTRTKPRKRRTPHKDEATEAEDAEWDPTMTRTHE